MGTPPYSIHTHPPKYKVTNIMANNTPSPQGLMAMHIQTLFTQNAQADLCFVNEPWGQTTPAPKLFVGQAADGIVFYKFRSDVLHNTRKTVCAFLEHGKTEAAEWLHTQPLDDCIALLGGTGCTKSLCYYVPAEFEETLAPSPPQQMHVGR